MKPFPLTPSSIQGALLALVPHGGQRAARKNAWAAMSSDAAVVRARREADLAMDAAVRRSLAGTASR